MNWTSVKVVSGRIGGNAPSGGSVARTARKLKPAAYDPDSVDMDNDGWHQEGTTAQWFGLGRNSVLFQALQKSFRNEGGGKLNDTVRRQFAELEAMNNAPPIELSDEDVDISFITGVLYSADPDMQEFSEAALAGAKRFLQYRRERRESLGGNTPEKPAEDIDVRIAPDADGSVKGAIKRLVEARKRRREERESRFQQDVDRKIDYKTKETAQKYKDALMTDVDYSLESFDEIYQRVSAEYSRKKRRPLADHWDNSPEIEDWELKNPRPTPQMYPDATELREVLLEWTDERFEKLWELSRPESEAWVQEVSRLADEEYKKVRGDLPGDAPDIDDDAILTELFTFSAVGRDGQIYEFQVDGVVDNYGEKMITGSIYGKNGIFVGNFERSFKPESKEVHHDHLILTENSQKLGLAGIFNARNEQVYKLMGYEFISLAGLSNEKEYIGATHWPKNGFDWKDEWERDKFLGRMKSFLEFHEREKRNGSDPNKPVTISLTKKLPDGSEQTIKVPLFASQEEYEMIKKMVDMAASQDFGDPNRLTADDLLQFEGAEEAFKLWKATINYVRYI
jgi:hypothetical protein